jgi:hypothetical protein
MYRVRYLMPGHRSEHTTCRVELPRALWWATMLRWHLGARYAFVIDV